jgi:ABC-type branched-subunit amino acid transport system substrate-binding protein
MVEGFIHIQRCNQPGSIFNNFPAVLLFILVIAFPANKAFSQEAEPNYGKTPSELLPYAKFQDPYTLFFTEPQPFLGPGRDKTPPTGLQRVKIGFLGPLEGSHEVKLGSQMLNGTLLAMEEANARGGYNGLPFDLITYNDVGLWGAAANEIVRMDDEKVWGIIGSIDGTVTHVALRVALKVEIPIVNTADSDPTLTETRIPWIIRCISDDRQSSYVLANHIFNVEDHRKVAVLRVNNRYGRVGIGEFSDASRRLGYPLLLHLRYSIGDTDFSAQLERIQNSSAEAVVIWGDAMEAGLIVKQMREMGMNHKVYGSDRIVSSEFSEIAGEYAEGITCTYPYNPTLNDANLQAFNRKYKERFGLEPDAFAAHSYDGMHILIEAIKIAGLNRARIRDVLTDLKTFQGYKGVTGEIVFDATWNDIGSIWMAELKNGKYQFSEPQLK